MKATRYLCFPATCLGPDPSALNLNLGSQFAFTGTGPQVVCNSLGTQFVIDRASFTFKVCYSCSVYSFKLSVYLYVLTF